MKTFNGKILFLNRSDINTDEIIPAKYLTENNKSALKPYLLEDLELKDFNPTNDIADKHVIITRSNFGCGSSREHAPWALEANGIHLVVAESFARIFRQNMFNCGMIALELKPEEIEQIFNKYANTEASVNINLTEKKLTIESTQKKDIFPITLSEFDAALINAGGWVEFADKNY